MNNVWFYDCPIGTIGIAEEDGAISRIFFDSGKKLVAFNLLETELIKKAAMQLFEYFDGKRAEFDLPLALRGTEFQMSVWRELESIPAGQTRSYKDIAVKIGNPRSCRAVGMANNRNPIAIIIPCHRVIGKNGNLTGYAGGITAKQYLLELEKRYIRNSNP